MSAELLTLLVTNFAMIGVLPSVFFRSGRHNLRWWATAGPFFANAALQLAAFAGWLEPLDAESPLVARRVGAAVLSAFSIGLIWYTVGTNRIPLALWHQSDDEPAEIVTWGAYQNIRHPFYAAFLLASAAGVVITPHPATLATFVWAAVALNFTARREERRLTSSAFGDAYRAYTRHTGRFVPRIGGHRSGSRSAECADEEHNTYPDRISGGPYAQGPPGREL